MKGVSESLVGNGIRYQELPFLSVRVINLINTEKFN
jgi:hypothetical protein